MAPRSTSTSLPSVWWLAVSIVIWLLAGGSFLAAIVHQSSANAPIGEGDVFLADIEEAAALVSSSPSTTEGVRRVRNELEVEAVSLVDSGGVITDSTSQSLIGLTVANPLLAFGVQTGRFAALAAAVDQPLEIDGVVEWAPGSILYQVVAPISPDQAVMLDYDVSELLSRRAQPGQIQPLTVQLLALGGVFAILGAAVFVGHSRAARRHREMEIESELLRVHSRELEEANVKLAQARRRAENALTLAEEKMRIRSEFVLMINHELRTPLTSVVTGAELMRDGQIGADDQREVIDSMIANGNRLNEIIDQILAVARIENRGITYEPETMPLEDICASLGLASSHPQVGESGISVHTDVKTLSLILGSLADNARTHGANSVSVSVHTEPQIDAMLELGQRPSPAVFFVVTDDGPGIDPHFLPRAFEKFEKNSFSSGTGLGLYMVRLMADALGASVAVHTSTQGTRFQIAIPARSHDREMETV